MNLPASQHDETPLEPDKGDEGVASSSDFAVVAEDLGKRFDIYNSDRGRIWEFFGNRQHHVEFWACLLYTSPSPRDATLSRMPSSA